MFQNIFHSVILNLDRKSEKGFECKVMKFMNSQEIVSMVISLLCQRIQFSVVVQCCTPFMLAGCCIYLTVSSGSGRQRQQRVHKASAPMVWLDMQESIFLVRGNELCLPHHSGRKRGL